jgi:hypothetical protein
VKRREFITLLGGSADTRPSRFGPRRCRSPQGLYVLLAQGRYDRLPSLRRWLSPRGPKSKRMRSVDPGGKNSKGGHHANHS